MFGRGFKAAKCKTLLRLALSRIKLLRNKRDNQLKGMRRDIATLLQTGQEPSARIRIEHVFREQNIVAAYEIVELFCELVVVRLPIIESQKLCPLDLKEAISSLIFAAPRCADLPELLEARNLFTIKYGKEFVAAAGELRPDCGVNRRIIEKLSVRAPTGEVKLKLLKEIAAEHNVEWDPSDSEAELLKQHEDLLDGPSHFVSHSQQPLPSQRQPIYMSPLTPSPPDEDEDELPSVPVQGPRSHVVPPSPPSVQPTKSFVRPVSPPSSPPRQGNVQQFVPFLSPPSFNSAAAAVPPSVSTTTEKFDYQDVVAAAQAAAESAERAASAARAAASLAKGSSFASAHRSKKDDSDSDGEAEVTSRIQQQASLPKAPSTKTVEESSSGSEEGDFYNGASSRAAKPVGKPQFDGGEEDDDDVFWRKPLSRGTSTNLSPPRAIEKEPAAKYDAFDVYSAENRASKIFNSFKSNSYETVKPSFDMPSQPQFDEPKAEDDAEEQEELFPPVPRTLRSSSNSIPPQRPPPEVPSPRPSLSPSDSGSGSFGHSAHPKLPDYDALTARFQALKTRRS